MTKQTLLIMVGAVVIFVGILWMFSAYKAEAPAVLSPVATIDTGTTTAVARYDATATTTILTNDTAQAALKGTVAPAVKSAPRPVVAKKPLVTVVTYDGQNFTPYKVTIMKGGTVRYLNLSSDDMWVASNIHPLHNEYPIHTTKDCVGSIFDECKAVGKGGFWDFTFTVEGGWGYHNHKHPISEGEVRVLLPGEKP